MKISPKIIDFCLSFEPSQWRRVEFWRVQFSPKIIDFCVSFHALQWRRVRTARARQDDGAAPLVLDLHHEHRYNAGHDREDEVEKDLDPVEAGGANELQQPEGRGT